MFEYPRPLSDVGYGSLGLLYAVGGESERPPAGHIGRWKDGSGEFGIGTWFRGTERSPARVRDVLTEFGAKGSVVGTPPGRRRLENRMGTKGVIFQVGGFGDSEVGGM